MNFFCLSQFPFYFATSFYQFIFHLVKSKVQIKLNMENIYIFRLFIWILPLRLVSMFISKSRLSAMSFLFAFKKAHLKTSSNAHFSMCVLYNVVLLVFNSNFDCCLHYGSENFSIKSLLAINKKKDDSIVLQLARFGIKWGWFQK